MLTWKDILEYARNGNPAPPRVVDRTDAEWKTILTPEQFRITREKGTEAPASGDSCNRFDPGVYTCVCCGSVLFDSEEKFDSGTGWPSFSQPVLENAIRYNRDTTHGMERIEALCNTCGAHLGHVFPDGPAPSELRYCMNSIAMEKHDSSKGLIETAVFGGGCFWCTEAIFKKINGVIRVEPGYSGGMINNPTYKEVCSGVTGHAEVIRITFEPQLIDYRSLVRIHMTTHDPTTLNRQGNDKGTQYRSVIFYANEQQKKEALEEINQMAGIYEDPIVTEVKALDKFYPAENYHFDYFAQHPNEPYCQFVIEPKVAKYRKQFSELQKK